MIILLLYTLNSMLNKQICLLFILCLQKIILNIQSLAHVLKMHMLMQAGCAPVSLLAALSSQHTEFFMQGVCVVEYKPSCRLSFCAYLIF